MNTLSHRQYNMDLERILLSVFVIILHFNNQDMGGALKYISGGITTQIFVRCAQSAAICAVDGFVILSGYFSGHSGRIPYPKAAVLLLTCSFYRVIGYICHVIFITRDFSVRLFLGYLIPSNWFVCLFVTLLLLTPFILRSIEGAEYKRNLSLLTGILFILFVIIPTVTSLGSDMGGVNLNGLATVTYAGDEGGFNIALFVCLYCLGMLLRASMDYLSRFGWWRYLICYMLFVALDAAVSHFSLRAWDYSNVMVVMEAVSLTLMFAMIKSPGEKTGRIISAVAGCSLGVFIWHTMPVMIFGLWSRFNIAAAFESGDMWRIAKFFLSAVFSMYLLSLVWVLICRYALRKPKEWITCILGRSKIE